MFCPRCGAEVEENSRYCPSCGNELPKGDAGSSSEGNENSGGPKDGLARVIGQDRRTRLLTLATILALAVAVIAFIALDDGGEEEEATVPQDALTRELDAICVQHKGELAQAQKRALSGEPAYSYPESFVPIVGEWQRELDEASVPAGRLELVESLKRALLEVQVEAGTFARALRESNRGEAQTAAVDLEAATGNVESAIATLELQRCSRLTISQGRLVRQ